MGAKAFRRAINLSLLSLTLQSVDRLQAQTAEDFYSSHSLTLLIPSSTGGINDLAGRVVAEHLGRFIPGHPKIVPENSSNASGAVLANRIYNDAPRDGSTIAIIERAVPQLAVQGHPDVRFDPLKMNWLGSLSSYENDAFMLAVNVTNPVKTIADLKSSTTLIRLGAMGPGITNLTFAILSKQLLGLNVDVAGGYSGAAPIFAAMRRGDVDGQVIGLGSLKGSQRSLWENRQVRPLVQFARRTRLPELADVPTGRELLTNTKDLALLEFAEQPFFMALPFVAPPGVPADRLKVLREAFMAMTKDAAYRAAAEKASLEVSPIDSAAIEKLLSLSAATPKDVITHYNEITGSLQR